MNQREQALSDRWFALGFLAAVATLERSPERIEAARRRAEIMLRQGRDAIPNNGTEP